MHAALELEKLFESVARSCLTPGSQRSSLAIGGDASLRSSRRDTKLNRIEGIIVFNYKTTYYYVTIHQHDIRINKSTKTSSTKCHIEDSDYVERAKLLEEQDEFARNNLVNNLLVEFIIFDKGYRCIAAALLTMDMMLKLPKEKASLKGGSSKTEVRGSTIGIGETGLVIMFVIITGAEAVDSKVIRFAGDEVSGGIESTEAVVRDRAIPSSSLSSLLTSSSGILSFSVACCRNFFLCRTCHNSAESLSSRTRSLVVLFSLRKYPGIIPGRFFLNCELGETDGISSPLTILQKRILLFSLMISLGIYLD